MSEVTRESEQERVSVRIEWPSGTALPVRSPRGQELARAVGRTGVALHLAVRGVRRGGDGGVPIPPAGGGFVATALGQRAALDRPGGGAGAGAAFDRRDAARGAGWEKFSARAALRVADDRSGRSPSAGGSGRPRYPAGGGAVGNLAGGTARQSRSGGDGHGRQLRGRHASSGPAGGGCTARCQKSIGPALPNCWR